MRKLPPHQGIYYWRKMTANRIFIIPSTAILKSVECHNIQSDEMTWQFYKRYGHLNYYNMKILQQKGLVCGIPNLKIPYKVCNICMMGKQHRELISKKITWKAQSNCNWFHSFICGPITPILNTNKRTILTFITDFSCKHWVYFWLPKVKL